MPRLEVVEDARARLGVAPCAVVERRAEERALRARRLECERVLLAHRGGGHAVGFLLDHAQKPRIADLATISDQNTLKTPTPTLKTA